MQQQYTVSTGMDTYQAASLIPWYDILTDEFIEFMQNCVFEDISLDLDDNLGYYLWDLFQHRMWIKSQISGWICNNGRRLEWDSKYKKMTNIKIYNIIDSQKYLLLELK